MYGTFFVLILNLFNPDMYGKHTQPTQIFYQESLNYNKADYNAINRADYIDAIKRHKKTI